MSKKKVIKLRATDGAGDLAADLRKLPAYEKAKKEFGSLQFSCSIAYKEGKRRKVSSFLCSMSTDKCDCCGSFVSVTLERKSDKKQIFDKRGLDFSCR